MNFQNNRYTLRMANSKDNKGIHEIFEDGSFSGGLGVQYLRGQKPYESFAADGNEVRLIVIYDNLEGRLAAIGGAVVRYEFLGGTAEKCAYLTGLKIHSDYRKKLLFIAKAYKYLGEQLSDCKCCYTTILDDNKQVIEMLEKPRKNMPEYLYIGHYITYCFHNGKKLLTLEKDNLNGFDYLLRTYFSKKELVPCSPEYKGFGLKHFYGYRVDGELAACCFVGDQTAMKQYKMNSYGGIYKIISHLPTKLLGYPIFPKSGETISHGVISYLYVRNNDPKLCSDFLRSVAAETNFSMLLWGGFEKEPLCKCLNKMKAIRYGSRLYQVVWNQCTALSKSIGVEVALL